MCPTPPELPGCSPSRPRPSPRLPLHPICTSRDPRRSIRSSTPSPGLPPRTRCLIIMRHRPIARPFEANEFRVLRRWGLSAVMGKLEARAITTILNNRLPSSPKFLRSPSPCSPLISKVRNWQLTYAAEDLIRKAQYALTAPAKRPKTAKKRPDSAQLNNPRPKPKV